MATKMPPQRIVRLTAENFKRLSAVTIDPDGAVVAIAGRNGAGKSSVLDAIEAAIGGKAHAPEQPIRRGAKGSRVVLELDDLIVTRKWTAKGDSLVVESKDGLRFPRPQDVLDRLTSGLSFDPLAFSRLKPREQAAQLRELVGLDTSALDEERAQVFATRTDVNRETKRLETELAAVVVPSLPAEVGEEIDLAEVADKKRKADAIRAENEVQRALAETLLDQEIANLDEIRDLEDAIAAMQQTLTAAKERAAATKIESEAATALAKSLVDPDIEAIDREIAAARTHNTGVRERQRQAEACEAAKKRARVLAAKLDDSREHADRLTARLDAIDAKKDELLAAAKFPIPGMEVDGDQVLIDGLPFSQASQAMQIRIGLAMGSALNPTLRVILCRDASLLDADSLRLVAEWARENEMQTWLETVGDGGAAAVLIEDGHVAGQAVDAEAVTA